MSAERKTSYQCYMAWDYDVEESELDQKSREGWQLEKGGCFHSTFVKNTDVCYRHRLDYNPDAMKDPAEKERYIAAFEDGGWEFINCTFNGWIYLRKPYQEGMAEEEFAIYSDGESLMGMFERFRKLGNMMSWLLFVTICYELWMAFSSAPAAGLTCAVILAAVLLWMRMGMRRLKAKQERLGKKI